MKVAVCFFGHLRTYKKCYKSAIKNIIEPNNADVFMHTWDTLEAKTETWHKLHIKNRFISEKEKKQIIKKYNLKKMVSEPQKFYQGSKQPCMISYQKSRSFDPFRLMYSSMRKSMNLALDYAKKNKFEYDVIVVMRGDLKILSKLDINKYDSNIINYCGCYRGFDYPPTDKRGYYEWDLLYFSKAKHIQKLLEYFPENSSPTDKNVVEILSYKNELIDFAKQNTDSEMLPTYDFRLHFDYIIQRKPQSLRQWNKNRKEIRGMRKKVLQMTEYYKNK